VIKKGSEAPFFFGGHARERRGFPWGERGDDGVAPGPGRPPSHPIGHSMSQSPRQKEIKRERSTKAVRNHHAGDRFWWQFEEANACTGSSMQPTL